jgi:hypothetical protein
MRDDEWQAAYNAGRESVAGLVEALRFYADEDNYTVGAGDVIITDYEVIADGGKIARTALEKYREGR